MPLRRPVARPVLAVLALAACGAGLAACGQSEEDRVRATLERFETASEERDFQTLCDDVLAEALVQQAERVGVPCELALGELLGGVQDPELTVQDVRLTGDGQASARVRTTARGQRPSTDVVRLVEEDGDWRISSLSSTPGPPSPEPERLPPDEE